MQAVLVRTSESAPFALRYRIRPSTYRRRKRSPQ
jgi:hypothetical protein